MLKTAMKLQFPIFIIISLVIQKTKLQASKCDTGPVSCQRSPYRSLDGSCNNLQNPSLGMAQTQYNRLLPPKYGDGIHTPTKSKSGKDLPNARSVSLLLYPDVPAKDPKFTLATMQYGQIITHDMSLSLPYDINCCTSEGQLPATNKPEQCYPIILHDNDPINKNASQPRHCMTVARTITDKNKNCNGKNHSVEQLSAVTHYLDLSAVYGSNDELGKQLRVLKGGKLKTEFRGGQKWLPRNADPNGTCYVQTSEEACYMAGDIRANQSPQLIVLQTTYVREHNRIANALASMNPHWQDETLYQEARKINIAQHQVITYCEWLPLFIGKRPTLNKVLDSIKLTKFKYDSNVDPRTLNEHATAEFRFFHSLIAGHLDLINDARRSTGKLRISDWFDRPAVIEDNNNFDDLLRGMAYQKQMKSDQHHDSEITQYFLRRNQQFGLDLKAIDIQRNRDHGLASYNDARKFCGLRKAKKFEDLLKNITKDNVRKLKKLYENVDDIDLTVGGSLESLVPGTLVGPTFLCILTQQFYRTKVGDRFWYENSGLTGFSTAQLKEIRKASISRLFCDNGHNVKSMQKKGFEIISEKNPVMPCHQLPTINLSKWKEN